MTRSTFEIVSEVLDNEVFLPFCTDTATVYDQNRVNEICAAHGWTVDEVIDEATRRTLGSSRTQIH